MQPDPAARALAIAARARENEAPSRDRNRERMPETARFVDEWRGVFGKLPYGRFTESGHTVTWGTPLAYSYAVQASVHPVPTKRIRGRK